MVTGAGNYETVKEEKHKYDDEQHHQNDNDLSAPQQAALSTSPSHESTNLPTSVLAPTGRDGRTIVQEETPPSINKTCEEVTDSTVVQPSQPMIKRWSTSKPIGTVYCT